MADKNALASWLVGSYNNQSSKREQIGTKAQMNIMSKGNVK